MQKACSQGAFQTKYSYSARSGRERSSLLSGAALLSPALCEAHRKFYSCQLEKNVPSTNPWRGSCNHRRQTKQQSSRKHLSHTCVRARHIPRPRGLGSEGPRGAGEQFRQPNHPCVRQMLLPRPLQGQKVPAGELLPAVLLRSHSVNGDTTSQKGAFYQVHVIKHLCFLAARDLATHADSLVLFTGRLMAF